jgi:endonuclease-3
MGESPDRGDTPSSVALTGDQSLGTVVDDPAAGGTYALVFEVAERATVEVGALGRTEFPTGDYAYVGSAFGPGGFARVDRHRRHLAGTDGTVHWHVDALTTLPAASFVAAVLAPGADVECAVARRLPPGPVDGFGASDCDCRSHLAGVPRSVVEGRVAAAVGATGRSDG